MEKQLQFPIKPTTKIGFQRYSSTPQVLKEKSIINETNRSPSSDTEEIKKFPNIEQFQQETYRLYLANVLLDNQVKEIRKEKEILQKKLKALESDKKAIFTIEQIITTQESSSVTDEKKKRHRRSAKDIERHFICCVENCKKSYGSEGSLAQHMKLKHNLTYEFSKKN